MGKKVLVVVVILLAFVAPRIYNLIKALGLHKSYINHKPGECRILPNIKYGSEDMEVMPDGSVLITSGLRMFGTYETDRPADHRGRVYRYVIEDPETDPAEVDIQGLPDAEDFNPHGISSWRDDDGVLLYISNHCGGHTVVHSFTYKDNVMTYRKTFKDSTFGFINDVVAIGRDQFYFTNFQYTRANPLEQFIGIGWASVGFYDVNEGRIVVPGLVGPNGINVSPDRRYIYVGVFGVQGMITYARNSDNSLNEIESTSLHTTVDNIMVEPTTGDIWIGGHYVMMKVAQYASDPVKYLAPSQILHLHMTSGHVTGVEEVLMDDGKMFSASSVAVYRDHKILVGSVHSNAMVCDVHYLT